jgi:methylmalonyl-CoA/ethylmalonyl-CoA epimerase
MEAPLTLGRLGQVSMLCRSTDQTETWYRDVLRLPEIFRFGQLVFFDCAGTRLYFRQVLDADWRPGSILYFLVDDVSAAKAELESRGVHFHGAPQMIFKDDVTGVEEWFAFFDDPDGNALSITSRVSPARR